MIYYTLIGSSLASLSSSNSLDDLSNETLLKKFRSLMKIYYSIFILFISNPISLEKAIEIKDW